MLERFFQFIRKLLTRLGIYREPNPQFDTNPAKTIEQGPSPIPSTVPIGQAEFVLKSGQGPEYRQRNSVFTFQERIFYSALMRDVRNDFLIFPKMRMGDVLWLANEPDDRKYHNNQIQCKHFDFVLCNHFSYTPLLVIELDDSTHKRPENQARDEFKDSLCKQVGLPLWRVNIQREYPIGFVGEQVRIRLQNSNPLSDTK